MTFRTILVAASLLASTSAWAQAAPGAEQTTEDLVCQLSEKCADEAATPAADAAATTPTPGSPRVSATRGFTIARKVSAPTTAKAPAARVTGGAKARVAADPVKRSTTNPGKARAQSAIQAMPLGRADLRVSFVTGSAELTEAGQREAQKFAAALASPLLAGERFKIEGHTDAVGGRDYNLDLSRRRAQAVVDYLVGKGAERARFDVTGHGFDKPLPGAAATAAVNRRVEVARIK